MARRIDTETLLVRDIAEQNLRSRRDLRASRIAHKCGSVMVHLPDRDDKQNYV